MDDKLTPQQRLAVTNRGGRLLVSAAAGSGKTKVLVDRLLAYLTDEQAPANLEEFLIITYTKAAATELRGKIAARLTERIVQEPENKHLQKQMQRLFLTKISTIHGFCADLLREYAYRLDIPADFRVADENECSEIRETVLENLLNQAYENKEENEDFLIFADSQGLGRDDRLLPQILQTLYDSARCHRDPNGWLDHCLDVLPEETACDAGNTPWGRFLIQQLQKFLDGQIQILESCIEAMERESGLEKQTANFRDIVRQLQYLRQAKTWDEIRARGQIQYQRLVFPKKNPAPELTERVKALRSACKEGLEKRLGSFSDSNEQVLEDLRGCAVSAKGLVALVKQFGQDYSGAKRSRRVLDFSDLEQRTLDLLLGKSRQGPTATAREIGRRYREVLVDEYQDSNSVQDAIFMALTQERQNCFLVGDVKQSIYQFRLADPGIFLEKYWAYKDAETARNLEGRKVLLSHNFRSGPEVIQGVNDVFRACMSPEVGGLSYTQAEQLREGAPHEKLGEPGVELYALETSEDTYAEEARFVAQKIETMLREKQKVRTKEGFRSVEPEDIVILLRSPGSAGGAFQQALEAKGIRCATGGGMDLLETEEVGTLRAFLEIIQNPRQDIPLLTALASPIFGFTANELALLRGRDKRKNIFDVLIQRNTPKVRSFLSILEKLRTCARMCTVTELLEQCFCLTRMDSIYGSMPGGAAKSANLQAFFQLAADFEKGALRDLSQFLNHLTVLGERGVPITGSASQGCVTIMSIHKSKGLEFPVVFLCNLSRRFNRENLRQQILCDRELGIGLSVADHRQRVRYPSVAKRAIALKQMQESTSEELRVLYVAMTRARDRLIMTYASKTLEKGLMDLALRQDINGKEFLCREASCPGEWVLIAALGRVEAGALHALGGRPVELETGEFPWKIEASQAAEEPDGSVMMQQSSESAPENLEQQLAQTMIFHYPYEAATRAPSKRTATDRKGRQKDEEAAEDTQQPTRYSWRKPGFRGSRQGGTAYGSAVHSALQYIRYEHCTSADAVDEEIRYLVEKGFLSREQGDLVNRQQLAAFFDTQLGRRLRSGTSCLREFKFSILDDGIHYESGLKGEQVLLQGVVDCALLEEDGITVIDFKTDRVTKESLPAVTERYRSQVEAYAHALERIYETKVKASYLYFFHLGCFAEMKPLDADHEVPGRCEEISYSDD